MKAKHHAKIEVQYLPPDYRTARLLTEFEYKDSKGAVLVPVGFLTNFASVPRMLQNLIPMRGPWSPAAVAHDHMYSEQRITRKEADRLFYKIMLAHNVGIVTARTMWAAVRAFGWIAWRQSKKMRQRSYKATS
jgi:hypothetical protein